MIVAALEIAIGALAFIAILLTFVGKEYDGPDEPWKDWDGTEPDEFGGEP